MPVGKIEQVHGLVDVDLAVSDGPHQSDESSVGSWFQPVCQAPQNPRHSPPDRGSGQRDLPAPIQEATASRAFEPLSVLVKRLLAHRVKIHYSPPSYWRRRSASSMSISPRASCSSVLSRTSGVALSDRPSRASRASKRERAVG